MYTSLRERLPTTRQTALIEHGLLRIDGSYEKSTTHTFGRATEVNIFLVVGRTKTMYALDEVMKTI